VIRRRRPLDPRVRGAAGDESADVGDESADDDAHATFFSNFLSNSPHELVSERRSD